MLLIREHVGCLINKLLTTTWRQNAFCKNQIHEALCPETKSKAHILDQLTLKTYYIFCLLNYQIILVLYFLLGLWEGDFLTLNLIRLQR